MTNQSLKDLWANISRNGLRNSFFVKACLIVINFSLLAWVLYEYDQFINLIDRKDLGTFLTQWLEIGLLAYIYIYCYLILKPVRGRSILAAMPIIISYLIQDIYFLSFGKVFRLIEVLELPELLQILPPDYMAISFISLVLPFIIFLAFINYRALKIINLGAIPLLLLACVIIYTPTSYTSFIKQAGNCMLIYSDAGSVKCNGRYVMMLYREAQRFHALQITEPYWQRHSYDQAALAKAKQLKDLGNRRNVHLIVLESFLDPTLFSGANFSKDPVHPTFNELFGDNLSLSKSPVFGGATAQAEFEILCGIPALRKLSSIEFNVFTGAPVYCLPGLLEKAGYSTIATNAFKPNFFNALPAYTGMGFSEIYFPEEFSATRDTYFNIGDVSGENYLFDGKLFEQNLVFIKDKLQSDNSKPLFNYIMTIYGHTPHEIARNKRPEIINVKSDYSDTHFQRVTNQYYYRTQAIAHYVHELIEIDPTSLIILVSDHLPPLQFGPNTYRKLNYLDNIDNHYYYNRLLIIENGVPIKLQGVHHYDLPDVIYDYITDDHFCTANKCTYPSESDNLQKQSSIDAYFSLMAHASEALQIQ